MRQTATPPWLKKRIVYDENVFLMKRLLADRSVGTVCESALCPNLNECFSNKRLTFLILGNVCTRFCGFCSVGGGSTKEVDKDEPARVADVVKRLGSTYCIITSVTRDDLADGGAGQFVETIDSIRRSTDHVTIEVLVPDFGGSAESVNSVIRARPDIFGHNAETVKRLYEKVRPGADYGRTLNIMRTAKSLNPGQATKSSIMLGLGETDDEVVETMEDLRRVGCDILAIGQYLRPKPSNLPVERFVAPEEFAGFKKIAEDMGFQRVYSGPFVRSSYFEWRPI